MICPTTKLTSLFRTCSLPTRAQLWLTSDDLISSGERATKGMAERLGVPLRFVTTLRMLDANANDGDGSMVRERLRKVGEYVMRMARAPCNHKQPWRAAVDWIVRVMNGHPKSLQQLAWDPRNRNLPTGQFLSAVLQTVRQPTLQSVHNCVRSLLSILTTSTEYGGRKRLRTAASSRVFE